MKKIDTARERKKCLLLLVAETAMASNRKIEPLKRADLYEGIAHILPSREGAERARHTAFMIREAEKYQIEMEELLCPETKETTA